jgi:hypothetical protein
MSSLGPKSNSHARRWISSRRKTPAASAPQEAARILGESVDFSRKGQLALRENKSDTSAEVSRNKRNSMLAGFDRKHRKHGRTDQSIPSPSLETILD